jgi:tripartite-type tricarboxylate transporter receptor subunit TctC
MVGNTATLANIPAVSKTPGYDPNSSFTGVAKIMDSFQVLVTSNDFPAENINDLVHLLKSNSSKMNFSAAGVGNLTHLSGELFKNKSNTNFEIIQYKSGAESINSILSGQTQFTIDNISIVKPLIMDKKLKALAVTSTVRQSDLPSTPTMKEAGFQDLIITSFFGVVAPIATPKSIVQKLNKAINEVITTNFMVDQFKRLGGQVSPESPEQFQNFIANEILKWSNIANQSGLKVE